MMVSRHGCFSVSNELLISPEWGLIYEELKKVFNLRLTVMAPANTTIFIGYSELFESVPEGGVSPNYMPIFETIDGKPKFIRFDK